MSYTTTDNTSQARVRSRCTRAPIFKGRSVTCERMTHQRPPTHMCLPGLDARKSDGIIVSERCKQILNQRSWSISGRSRSDPSAVRSIAIRGQIIVIYVRTSRYNLHCACCHSSLLATPILAHRVGFSRPCLKQ